MILDYIYHSGFALEAEGVTVIIDYYKDSSEAEHSRGIVHDYLLQKPGKLYVLATHFHPDHFNREILTWKEQRPDIHYIFSKDILKSHRAQAEDAIYIKKGETYEDETLRIDAFGSTDVGINIMKLLFVILAMMLVAIALSPLFFPSVSLILLHLLIVVVVTIGVVAYYIKHPSAMEPRRRKRRRINDEYWTALPWFGGVKKREDTFGMTDA